MKIIINGGTRGIGKEIVKIFSSDKDNKVLVTGRNHEVLNEISSNAKNKNILICCIDLSVFDSQHELLREIVKSYFTGADILINNAGTLINQKFMDFSNSRAREIMETNFFGPASVIRVIKPFMKRGSHIVNISSMGGYLGSVKYPGLSYYSASKAALSCLSECLAEEFRADGISVNCLALGSVQTEMLEEAFPGYKAPVSVKEMAGYIVDFAKNGHKVINGKTLPVAVTNP